MKCCEEEIQGYCREKIAVNKFAKVKMCDQCCIYCPKLIKKVCDTVCAAVKEVK